MSFVTPCSTLYASPAKIDSDLFCAFQPNRVMEPSLPLRLKCPPIAAAALCAAVPLNRLTSCSSEVFSTRPSPNVGVGMRKITLLAASWAAKSGYAVVQDAGASTRPAIV